MFKARFFSSSKKSDSSSSSPDGSAANSPRSVNSDSPTRSKSKSKTAVKSSLSSAATTPTKKPSTAEASSASPILASSLGLNRIKTRSGPLPQESFFGFGGDKLGSSNLSKTAGASGSKKKEKEATAASGGWGDNGGNLESVFTSSAPSKEQSSPSVAAPRLLQNSGESSSTEAARKISSRARSGVLRSSELCTPEPAYDCENPKESESPRFQAILRLTSAPRKRHPADIKSFSHELNSKGVRPFPFWKPRGLNNLQEILVGIRAKFDKAKEEVDSDLAVFAADLVGVLEKDADTHPDWQETIEDLLILARRCAMATSGEFWLQCESVVQ